MCWFSAYGRIPTRRAIEGEELIVQQFSEPSRRWLGSMREPGKAVCLPDGCVLRLNDIPASMQKLLRVQAEAVAEFREVHQPPRPLIRFFRPAESVRDVLVFSGGSHFHVGMLPLGMRLDVLSTGETVAREDEPQEELEALLVSRR